MEKQQGQTYDVNILARLSFDKEYLLAMQAAQIAELQKQLAGAKAEIEKLKSSGKKLKAKKLPKNEEKNA